MRVSFCPQGEFRFAMHLQAFESACERAATVGVLECRMWDMQDYIAGIRYGQRLRQYGVRRDGKRPRGRRDPSEKFRLGTNYGRTMPDDDIRRKLVECRAQVKRYEKAIAEVRAG